MQSSVIDDRKAEQIARRPTRVTVPVLVTMKSGTLTVREFTLNLSEGGIFLQTEAMCPVGQETTLTFRATQFDKPFRLKARVVRTVAPGEESDGQDAVAGLGIQFLGLTDDDRDHLRHVVEGVRSGSVVQSIRESIKNSKRPPELELRSRPTSQKLMLAMAAKDSEVKGLIRDANPVVLVRLLNCPNVKVAHVTELLHNRGLPSQVVSAVKADRRFMSNEAVRWLFCTHPAARLNDVMSEMTRLPLARIQRLAMDTTVRPQVRMRAAELAKKRGRGI
jgi:uncharacterized protein (TIGR02266 family)